jgi:lysozyme family protein
MTIDQILDDVAVREGLRYEDNPKRIDQPTGPYGITLPVLSAARGRPCTLADLKALTPAEAREITRATIIRELRALGFDRIVDERLRLQLLDFSWNSGAERAIRWLQRTVGLAPQFVDGRIGPKTLLALAKLPGFLVNNALAGERAHAAYHGGVRTDLAPGVAHRAIEFVVPTEVI